MGNWEYKLLSVAILTSVLLLSLGECKKKKNSLKKPNNETTLFKFLWLVVYRVAHGFASIFGGQEMISEFMGGILVPPGVDDDDGGDVDEDYKDGGDYY